MVNVLGCVGEFVPGPTDPDGLVTGASGRVPELTGPTVHRRPLCVDVSTTLKRNYFYTGDCNIVFDSLVAGLFSVDCSVFVITFR